MSNVEVNKKNRLCNPHCKNPATTCGSIAMLNDKRPAWENTFIHIMELWITPEVIRRQAAGRVAKPFNLQAAQVLFFPDGRSHQIRLNEEVRAVGKVKLKQGVKKAAGDPVYAHEVEGYESFRLLDDEDPNCGHITIRRIADQWSISFDFIYNKGTARDHLMAAREFLDAARHARHQGHWRAFVDTCFSGAELAAKSLLMTTPSPNEKKSKKHGRIHSRYNLEAKLGNVKEQHRKSFNRLTELRASARYLDGALVMDAKEADELFSGVEDAIAFAEKRIAMEKV
jgi:HEPN domain-containing protein